MSACIYECSVAWILSDSLSLRRFRGINDLLAIFIELMSVHAVNIDDVEMVRDSAPHSISLTDNLRQPIDDIDGVWMTDAFFYCQMKFLAEPIKNEASCVLSVLCERVFSLLFFCFSLSCETRNDSYQTEIRKHSELCVCVFDLFSFSRFTHWQFDRQMNVTKPQPQLNIVQQI